MYFRDRSTIAKNVCRSFMNIESPLWSRYSKKMREKIFRCRSSGFFSEKEALARAMFLARGKAGVVNEGNALHLFWLVDESDGIIVDAKFQIFGHSALLAAAESACELLIGKNYEQAKRISAELIDKQLRDYPDQPAFPEEALFHLNLVIEAIEEAASSCASLPLPEKDIPTPVPRNEEGEGYPGWIDLPREEKLAVIEDVLNEEIRPYIELDAGGISVRDLIGDKELIVAYQGACTSCHSSVGSTLSAIQHLIRTKVHPDLIVVPDMDALQF